MKKTTTLFLDSILLLNRTVTSRFLQIGYFIHFFLEVRPGKLILEHFAVLLTALDYFNNSNFVPKYEKICNT